MLNILVTPVANNKNGERYTKKVVKYLKSEKVEFSVYFSESFDALKNNASTLTQSGETDFVLIGDDTSISEFINSVKDISKLRLALIPTNKRDDYASYLKLETNPVLAIKNVLKGEIEHVDVLVMNDIKVVNNIIIGSSVMLAEIYNQYKMRNKLSNLYAFMRYGNKFDGIDLKCEIKNQKTIVDNVFELSIANGGNSKGKPVSPLANVSDGLFNFNYISTPQPENRKRYLRSFKKGEQIYNEQTKQMWLNNIKITNPDNKIKVMADGKIMTVEEINVVVLEKALKIFKTSKH